MNFLRVKLNLRVSNFNPICTVYKGHFSSIRFRIVSSFLKKISRNDFLHFGGNNMPNFWTYKRDPFTTLLKALRMNVSLSN